MRAAAILAATCLAIFSSGAAPDGLANPDIELESEALTPGLVLRELREPIHQVRLFVKINGRGPGRGVLVLDPNVPGFDEFEGLVGGLQTPHVQGKGGPLRTVELACNVEFVKEGPDNWLLFRLDGPKIASKLFISTRGPILEGGPARLLELGGDQKVKSVVALTRYGLVVP